MNLILIGPQGSGKGTQAHRVASTFDLKIVEMGGVLRAAAEEENERGRLIDDLINEKGKLLPDGVVLELLEEYLETLNWQSGLIFDGYPRTIKQFNLLEDYLVDRDEFLHAAVYLNIPDELAVERLANRLTCTVCGTVYNTVSNPPPSENACTCGGELKKRSDDNPDAIRTRLALFHESTQPILTLMEEKGILIKVDGTRSTEEVTEEIKKVLTKKGFGHE